MSQNKTPKYALLEAIRRVSIFTCFPLLMPFSSLKRYFLFSFRLVLFSLAMKPKRSSNSLFGAADSLSGAQLPTYLDVGKAWRQCRLDMESENPGTNILNRQIARKVRKDSRQKKKTEENAFVCVSPQIL